MKVLKYIGQILAAIIYTCIFTGIMYLIITIPLAFIISLPWWGILLFVVIGGGLLEGIIQMLGTFGIAPYLWIVNGNSGAAVISVLLVLFNVGSNIYRLWVSIAGQGNWAIVFGIVATGLLLQFVYIAIVGIVMARSGALSE